jgi:hypothetical protein
LAPVSWEHDFYVVTIKHLKQTAQRAGFDVVHVRNFNYLPEVIPRSLRWAARLLERPDAVPAVVLAVRSCPTCLASRRLPGLSPKFTASLRQRRRR